MICLGIDVGSTSIKGAVLDLEQRQVQSIVRAPFPPPVAGLPAGYFEVDPDAVQSAVEQVIDELVGHAPGAVALFCSGQMGGVVLVDASGRALTNYLSWRDQRTQQSELPGLSSLDRLRQRWVNGQLEEVGRELAAGSASSLMFWLAEQNRLPAGCSPATVADYVLGRLCRVSPQMDRTQAIGLLDLRTGDWHRSAFEQLGLQALRWPQIADRFQPLGQIVRAGRTLDCYASFGDQQCALYGVQLAENELSLNISTGSQVSRRSSDFVPGPYQTRYFLDGRYLNTITHLPAGRSLNVLVDLLTELPRAEGIELSRIWETISQLAESADGGGLQTQLTFFAGPLGQTGQIEGITTDNLNVGNLFYAAFENMADNYVACANRLCPDRHGPDRQSLSLALSGGLTRSVPVLRRLIEARFGMSSRESSEAEETLTGLLEIATEVYDH